MNQPGKNHVKIIDAMIITFTDKMLLSDFIFVFVCLLRQWFGQFVIIVLCSVAAQFISRRSNDHLYHSSAVRSHIRDVRSSLCFSSRSVCVSRCGRKYISLFGRKWPTMSDVSQFSRFLWVYFLNHIYRNMPFIKCSRAKKINRKNNQLWGFHSRFESLYLQ